jgi:hypothetical protein
MPHLEEPERFRDLLAQVRLGAGYPQVNPRRGVL